MYHTSFKKIPYFSALIYLGLNSKYIFCYTFFSERYSISQFLTFSLFIFYKKMKFIFGKRKWSMPRVFQSPHFGIFLYLLYYPFKNGSCSKMSIDVYHGWNPPLKFNNNSDIYHHILVHPHLSSPLQIKISQ